MQGLENNRMGSRRKELIAPCKGCGKREPGCHDRCEGYKEYCKVNEQRKAYELEHCRETVWDPLAPKRRRDL